MGLKYVLGNVLTVIVAVLALPLFLSDPKYPTKIEELSTDLQEWYRRGNMMKINNRNMFYIYEKCNDATLINPPTFVIIHGYPSSSHEYHRVLDPLLKHGNVMVHDHVGFGFSDKPGTEYTYSLSEAADNALSLWRALGIQSAHVVAHDMGDSILTEILARRHRKMLPDYFKDFFQTVMFSNGGMKYSEISFRLIQILLRNDYFGPYFSKLLNRLGISDRFFSKQLWTIAGKNVNAENMNFDIKIMQEVMKYNGGKVISHKTIYYLWDRAHFEYKWFAALSELDIPSKVVWGDSDAVVPNVIPRFISGLIPGTKLDFIPGAGHFIMLEKPYAWLEHVIQLPHLV